MEIRVGKLILVADDAKEILAVYESILTEEGYEVSLVSDYTSVVEEVRQLKPDLIIMDLIFNDKLVGWKVAKQLRERDTLATESPIIISSASFFPGKQVQIPVEDRNIWWLAKPFDIEELLTMVESLIGKP